jgi:hypothetical protein
MLNDKKQTKPSKIIFGFLLLLGVGQEYIHASRDLGTFFSPSIIVLITGLLLLATWLIGSGFSSVKFSFKSFEFIKFFIISFVFFITVAFFTLLSYAKPDNFKTVNGISIPMNKCIDGSRRMIPNKEERMDYCLCLAEKITTNPVLKKKYKNDLKKGRLIKVSTSIQKEEELTELSLTNCLTNVEMKWTDNIANSMLSICVKELEGSEFEQTGNTQIYCECVINEYKKYSLNKIIATDFQESELAISIDSSCTEKSQK